MKVIAIVDSSTSARFCASSNGRELLMASKSHSINSFNFFWRTLHVNLIKNKDCSLAVSRIRIKCINNFV